MDQPTQIWLQNLNDLIYVVAHEFNNVLNNILLQVAIVEQLSAGQSHRELEPIRRLSTQAASMVRQLQRLSQKHQPPLQPVDLSQLLGKLVQEAGILRPVQLELAADLPPVLGTIADLKRLIELLLHNAPGIGTGSAALTLRTERRADRVRLSLQHEGSAIADELLPQLFEPFGTVPGSSEGWELAVCKAVVRRLQGSIHAENRPEGGVAFVVELRVAGA